MESLSEIARILEKAGYHVSAYQNGNLYITDPTCVWPILTDFIHVAWVILAAITGFLLAGWGITMVRGANHDMVKNLRTLVLIFGSLSVAIPAVNMLGAGSVIVGQCEQIEISQAQANELLEMSASNGWAQENYEVFEIIDSEFDNDADFSALDEQSDFQ